MRRCCVRISAAYTAGGRPARGSVCGNEWPVVQASNEASGQVKRSLLGEPLSRAGTPPGATPLRFGAGAAEGSVELLSGGVLLECVQIRGLACRSFGSGFGRKVRSVVPMPVRRRSWVMCRLSMRLPHRSSSSKRTCMKPTSLVSSSATTVMLLAGARRGDRTERRSATTSPTGNVATPGCCAHSRCRRCGVPRARRVRE